jgi:hypothetical protein
VYHRTELKTKFVFFFIVASFFLRLSHVGVSNPDWQNCLQKQTKIKAEYWMGSPETELLNSFISFPLAVFGLIKILRPHKHKIFLWHPTRNISAF